MAVSTQSAHKPKANELLQKLDRSGYLMCLETDLDFYLNPNGIEFLKRVGSARTGGYINSEGIVPRLLSYACIRGHIVYDDGYIVLSEGESTANVVLAITEAADNHINGAYWCDMNIKDETSKQIRELKNML